MTEERECAWFECTTTFEPQPNPLAETRPQRFCCTACRIRMNNWITRRGATLVRMVLADNVSYPDIVAEITKIRRDYHAKNPGEKATYDGRRHPLPTPIGGDAHGAG